MRESLRHWYHALHSWMEKVKRFAPVENAVIAIERIEPGEQREQWVKELVLSERNQGGHLVVDPLAKSSGDPSCPPVSFRILLVPGICYRQIR